MVLGQEVIKQPQEGGAKHIETLDYALEDDDLQGGRLLVHRGNASLHLFHALLSSGNPSLVRIDSVLFSRV